MPSVSSRTIPPKPIELKVGQQVDYHARAGVASERGVVTSFNDSWVWVRFGPPDTTSAACHWSSLTLPGSSRRLR
jgi:hypothetical protein